LYESPDERFVRSVAAAMPSDAGPAPVEAACCPGGGERTAELARRGDEVSVVNVMPEPGVSSRIGPFVEERRRQAALLDEAARFLSRRGIEARCVAAVGGAATETLAFRRATRIGHAGAPDPAR
jgi:NADPH-dependent glutamate synthase beta subunit-like oxidoreductase